MGQPQMEASRYLRDPLLGMCACMEVFEIDPPVSIETGRQISKPSYTRAFPKRGLTDVRQG
eukprot:3340313-Lingulodinium_polyedra.AAC.1